MIDLHAIATEQRNEQTRHIDRLSTLDMIRLINEEDTKAALAVGAIAPAIADAVDLIAGRLRQGGRLFYIGSGTSGRLGILDAVECPPTYSTDPDMVQGLIAGGYEAIFRAKEGAEDSQDMGRADLAAKAVTAKDVVVGLSASGRTPYVLGGLARRDGRPTSSADCSTPLPSAQRRFPSTAHLRPLSPSMRKSTYAPSSARKSSPARRA